MSKRVNRKKFDAINLSYGAHDVPENGMCPMEAVSYIMGENKFSDRPQCVCPVIAGLLRSWNDELPNDDERNRLIRPLLHKTVGTRGKGDDLIFRRMWLVVDWQIRVYTPAFLKIAGLEEAALSLKNLPVINSLERLKECEPKTSAARSAADSAADSAARSGRAPALARGSAARSAAYSAARSAAYSAAYSVADSVADSVASSAARSAADFAAYYAASSVAEKVLMPTVKTLQERMVKLILQLCKMK